MSIPIISESTPPLIGGGVTKTQIKNLVDNYYLRMQKSNGTVFNPLDRAKDSKSVWFSKLKIDELFRNNIDTDANNADYGLRIYFGVHKKGILLDTNGDDIPTVYENQQTVVLVVTKNENGSEDHDQLDDGSAVQIAGYRDAGMDTGKLCPPMVCDGSEIKFV